MTLAAGVTELRALATGAARALQSLAAADGPSSWALSSANVMGLVM